ncbi:MAG: phenylacetate--CoA ligase family protein [Candidatus Omnitrophica bacterium]|nr:hypothetical protein [bacterium]NUN96194.1 phenylacetate--CoA ligase family protein [Candidatus Omnitrophota bacterium]
MTLPETLLRSLVFPLASFRAGNRFSEEYRLLRESQWWPRAQLRKLQLRRTRELLGQAFRTVPFYREWLGDHGLSPEQVEHPDQLKRLPILTKEILRDQPEGNLVSTAAGPSDRIPYSTSGSTGEPFRFLVNRRLNGSKIARYLREMSVWGIDPGTPFLKVWGAGRVPTSGSRFEKKFFTRTLLNRREESAFDLDEQGADRLLDLLRAKQFSVLESYTSTAMFLASRARERGIELPLLHTVVVSGETLTAEQKCFIETSFGAAVINAYGSREFGRVAFSTRDGEGLCLSMEDFYAELLEFDPPDPSGLRRLVLTCFSNTTQPFIRYDTGDLVEAIIPEIRLGKRGLEVWRAVHGRLAERVVTPSGKHLSVHFLTLLLEDMQRQVRQFQAVVENPELLSLLVVPGAEFNPEIESTLRVRIEQHIGPAMRVEIRRVDSIPASGDGKRPLLRWA